MQSDSLNQNLENSQINDSTLNESTTSSSRTKNRKTLKDYEFVINENSKYNTSELGKGAYGTVKKVRDLATGKIYAMKIMSKKAIFEYSNKENLKREISIQRKMHHPHIIRLHTCFEDSENVYLVLEYAENGSLFQYLRRKKTLTESEAFIFFFQTCLGINYLHWKNVIHRDLKPENLLLDGEGNIKLCDFGWSADDLSKRHTFCGTVDYLAPEMIKNHPHDHRIDIWCLGILLYEMLHGKAPFKGRTDQEKTKNISANTPIYFDPALSADVVDLIQRILKPIPMERITMGEIFVHPWLKHHEKVFGMDIMSYVGQTGITQSVNESFAGQDNNNMSVSSNRGKIITIQDTTPLVMPTSKPSEEKKPKSETNSGINIEQFLKDYKIDATAEMSVLNKVEKFSSRKASNEAEQAQPIINKMDYRKQSMPQTTYASQEEPLNKSQDSGYNRYNSANIEQSTTKSEFNPYAHQDGEGLEQFLNRIRTQNRGGTQSENPFASGYIDKNYELIKENESPRFSQNVPGSGQYHKADTASFGNRSTFNQQKGYEDDDDYEPQRLSRLSKRNQEIGRQAGKVKKELNFFEKILVEMGCMARGPSKTSEKYG